MYRALESFSGLISMYQNEVRAIEDKEIVKDLLGAGYIEEYKPASDKKPKVTEVTDTKKEPSKSK